MEPLSLADLPDEALLLIDSAPIIYVLERGAALRLAQAELGGCRAGGKCLGH